MAEIWIPAMLRDLTDGKERLTIPGSTLLQVIDELVLSYPDLKLRLLEGDQLRPDFSVVVDGNVSHLRLRQPLFEDSEVHLLPVFNGG